MVSIRKSKNASKNRIRETDFVLVEGKKDNSFDKIPVDSKRSKRSKKYSKKYKEFGKTPQFPMCMESYKRGVSTRIGSFEMQESDDDQGLDEQQKNSNNTISISLESNYNDSTMEKKEPLVVNLNNDDTQNLEKDYFLVRTYHRGGSCLVKVPLEPEEIEMMRKQKTTEQHKHVTTDLYVQEKNKLGKSEENVLIHPNICDTDITKDINEFNHNTFNKESDNQKEENDFTCFCHRRFDNMKNFTDFCDSRLEKEKNYKKELQTNFNNNNIVTTRKDSLASSSSLEDLNLLNVVNKSGQIVRHHRTGENNKTGGNNKLEAANKEISAFSSNLEDFDLLHIMDESGKILWNKHKEEYNKDKINWHENVLFQQAIDQKCNVVKADNVLQNSTDDKPEETRMIIGNTFKKYYNSNLEIVPDGFRLEVQSPDPRIYVDNFISNQYLILNSEPSVDHFA